MATPNDPVITDADQVIADVDPVITDLVITYMAVLTVVLPLDDSVLACTAWPSARQTGPMFVKLSLVHVLPSEYSC